MIADADGTVTMANSEAERIFGYSKGTLHGCLIQSLVGRFWLDSDPSEIDEPLELPGFHKDGSSFPLSIRMKTISTPTGFILLFFSD